MMHTSSARADVSSWLGVGGGYSAQRNDATGAWDHVPVLTYAVGTGSSPNGALVVGGILRGTTYFSLGTDINLSVRFATGGFARGQWGAALDVGPSIRLLWGDDDYGKFPIHGMAWLGAPWGLELGAGADFLSLSGEPFATGVKVVAGIDLLRLTVMRRGATDKWWNNPSPAGAAYAPSQNPEFPR